MGRPLTYTPETAQLVLDAMSDGDSLRDVCQSIGVPPSTVRNWVVDNVEGFGARYARARILQAQAWEDKLLTVAADGSKDTIIKYGRDGSEYEAPDNEWINRSRLIVDTMKWTMAKLHPKQYGERVATELSGPNGGPITVSWLAPGSAPKEEK